MSIKRLQARCPGASPIGKAYITGYSFSFNKISKKDGTGKGNLNQGSPADQVWGVVFQIPLSAKPELDSAEGLGYGYNIIHLHVKNENDETIEVIAYIATEVKYINNKLLPLDWYMEHCLIGAREFNLPENYIKFLNQFDFVVDHDEKRKKQELSIYNL